MTASILDSVGIILAVAAGWTAVSMLTALALLVRKWDRASEGLVAGTHKSWQEGTAQNIRETLDADAVGRAELDEVLTQTDLDRHLVMVADAWEQLSKTMIGFRKPVEEAVFALGGLVRTIERPGVQLTHTHLGAGRYKVTYTEGTIIDAA